jgi:hypothetical protein
MIAPGAEILHVQIAHSQHLRRPGQVGTNLRPHLNPAVEGGAQKLKWIRGHAGVFQSQIGRNNRNVFGQPRFILLGRFFDTHRMLPP